MRSSRTTHDGLGTTTGGRGPTGRRGRAGLRVGVAALTGLLVALAVLPAQPAEAARKKRGIATASTNWVVEQAFLSTGIAVKVQWPKVKGATSYEIDFVRSSDGGQRVGAQIQRARSKRTVKVRSTGGAIRSAWVGGLTPGQVYCFQVRGKSGKRVGGRGPAHCKQTVSAGRVPRSASSTMAVGTYNVCSARCYSMLPWSARKDLTLQRIRELTAPGGRPVDVLSVQEGLYAVDNGGAFDTALANTFTKGCLAPNRLEALYVRTSTYTVVRGTASGMTFGPVFGDETHGACWVRVRENATGREFVVASVHLLPGEASGTDAVRTRQMQAVMAAIGTSQPGQRVVYAGDFNSSRSRPFDGPRLALAATGHEDAYDQALIYGSPPMMNSATGEDAPIRKSWMWGDHIDRVFAPPGAHVASWRVDMRTASSKVYATPMPSDHNPVVALINLPG